MSGLVSFLLFGALFFVMMRFGCGAHAGHGGHQGGHGEHDNDSPSAAVDPVCGMAVALDKGYTKVYRGQSYRFCSRDCLDKFEASPDQYLSPQHGAGDGPRGHES